MSRTITNHHHHYNSHYIALPAPTTTTGFVSLGTTSKFLCRNLDRHLKGTYLTATNGGLRYQSQFRFNSLEASFPWPCWAPTPMTFPLMMITMMILAFVSVCESSCTCLIFPFPCSIHIYSSDVFYCSKHATLHYLMLDPMKILLIIKLLLYYSIVFLYLT